METNESDSSKPDLTLEDAKKMIAGEAVETEPECVESSTLSEADLEHQIVEMIVAGQSDDQVKAHFSHWSKETGKLITEIDKSYCKLRRIYTRVSDDQAQREGVQFTEMENAFAQELEAEGRISSRFHQDFNLTGYWASALLTKMALLVIGFQKLNLVAWQKTGTLMGTQTMVYGSSSAGKSAYVEQILRFLDCTTGGDSGVIERQSSCSELGLVFAGGTDGEGLANKIVVHDELNPPAVVQPFKMLQIIWQLTTKGVYIHKSSEEVTGKGRRSVQYVLKGPVHHVATTVTHPLKWDEQWRNRSFWIEITHNMESLVKVMAIKLGAAEQVSVERCREIWKGWNCFFSRLQSLDSSNSDALNDIEMSFLRQIHEEGDRESLHEDDCRRVDLLKVLIASHALLNQHNREVNIIEERKVLVATIEDYNEVVDVFECCVPSVYQASGQAHENAFYKIIEILDDDDLDAAKQGFGYKKKTLSRLEMRQLLVKSKRTVDSYVAAWRELGLIEVASVDPGGEQRFKSGPKFSQAQKEMVAEQAAIGCENFTQLAAKRAIENSKKVRGFLPRKLRTRGNDTSDSNGAKD